jgi:hypothetical protein
MGVYVVHRSGVWSMKDRKEHDMNIINLFKTLSVHLDRKYHVIINHMLRYRYFALSEELEHRGDVPNAKFFLMKSIKTHLQIAGEMHGYGRTKKKDWINSMPDYLKLLNFSRLFKSFLRLYLVTALELYLPLLHRVSRKIAQRLKFDLY